MCTKFMASSCKIKGEKHDYKLSEQNDDKSIESVKAEEHFLAYVKIFQYAERNVREELCVYDRCASKYATR